MIAGERSLSMGQEKERQLQDRERQRERELEEQGRAGYVPPIRPFERDPPEE